MSSIFSNKKIMILGLATMLFVLIVIFILRKKANTPTQNMNVAPLHVLKFLPVHTLRNDTMGKGHFGASRTGHSHKGVDLVAPNGTPITLNVKAIVEKIGLAYTGDNNYNSYHLNLGNGYLLKLLYIKPLFKIGDTIEPGNTIGIMQNISKKWGASMINHLHVEMYKDGKLIDPTNLLF